MKKIFMIMLVLILLLITSCSWLRPDPDPMIRVEDCGTRGYVSITEANKLVEISNKLVDIANACVGDANVTKLPHIMKYPE